MRWILCCSCIAAFASVAEADDDDDDRYKLPKRPRIGIRVGANFSNVHDNLPGRYDDRTGFAVGAFTLVPLRGRFSLDACIAYSQKGATSTDDREHLVLDNIQIPIVLASTFALGETSRARGFVGPSVDINVDASLDSSSSSIDRRKTTANVDVGIVAGAGIDLETGGGVIVIDLRYEVGLTDIDSTEADVMHRVLSANVGFAY